MNSTQILEAMTDIDCPYIASAQQRLGYGAERPAPRRRVLRKALAIAAAAIVMTAALFTAAMAVSPELREAVSELMEALFPPKTMAITLEGLPETVPHAAHGKMPEADSPGFAIYIDDSRYAMAEEDGVFFIRPAVTLPSREDIRSDLAASLEGLSPEEQEAAIDRRLEELEEFYASLPACEMEIRELAGITPEAAAERARAELAGTWESVSEITRSAQPPCLSFYASGGLSWDSPQEEHCFFSSGQQGTFQIVLRYYLEAAEGHGSRFRAMLDTFEVIAPQGP